MACERSQLELFGSGSVIQLGAATVAVLLKLPLALPETVPSTV